MEFVFLCFLELFLSVLPFSLLHFIPVLPSKRQGADRSLILWQQQKKSPEKWVLCKAETLVESLVFIFWCLVLLETTCVGMKR